MSIHINAKKGEIAKIVIMPGDPNRAKLAASKFLTDYKEVTNVRGILGYTGKYGIVDVTIMASGMGIPSMGIYSYELFTEYDVDIIIRVGSMGAINPTLHLRDIVLAKHAYSESNFTRNLMNEENHLSYPNSEINDIIFKTSIETNTAIKEVGIATTECFDIYTKDPEAIFNRIPEDIQVLGCEMEAFALFETARFLNKKAATLLTVVDANYSDERLSTEDREKDLNSMIKLALDSSIKLANYNFKKKK